MKFLQRGLVDRYGAQEIVCERFVQSYIITRGLDWPRIDREDQYSLKLLNASL